jgi:hypothetical protein
MSPECSADRRSAWRLKGEAGEDLFAAVFVVLLIVGFIASVNAAYGKWVESQTFIYSARAASSVAERLFYNSSGVVTSDCSALATQWNLTSVQFKLTWWEGSFPSTCSFGQLNASISQSISSMPVLVGKGGRFYPGRVDVAVGV